MFFMFGQFVVRFCLLGAFDFSSIFTYLSIEALLIEALLSFSSFIFTYWVGLKPETYDTGPHIAVSSESACRPRDRKFDFSLVA